MKPRRPQKSDLSERPRSQKQVPADDASSAQPLDPVDGAPWYRSTLVFSMTGGLLLWAAFPPLGWWPLAWPALVFWVWLIQQPQLHGRRPYLVIWLAASLHWLAMLQGIRLAYPALILGWLALSLYVAVYLPLFIGLSRVAVHRWRVPLVVAAPAVWCGLELARGHILTGFSMGLLGHTQWQWTTLIQIVDLVGGYGVGFVIVCAAACIVRVISAWQADRPFRPLRVARPLILLLVLFAAVLGYGRVRLSAPDDAAPREPLRVALIQGSFDTVFGTGPERSVEQFLRYLELSRDAVRSRPDLDLLIWPEGTFTGALPDVVVEGDELPEAEGLDPEEIRERLRQWVIDWQYKANQVAGQLNRHNDHAVLLLLGTDTQHLGRGPTRRYNSAVLLDGSGQVRGRYYKMHRVMFGEYIPLGDLLPWIYKLTPMPFGLTPGQQPQALPVAGYYVAPSICFESTVPHLTRWQLTSLQAQGTPPSFLVNLTNDGWFWGSSILDLHFMCNVFRAVENDIPVLVAANTGISAVVDARGRCLHQAPRRQDRVVLADCTPGSGESIYLRTGDLFAGVCLLFCATLALVSGASGRIRGLRTKRTE